MIRTASLAICLLPDMPGIPPEQYGAARACGLATAASTMQVNPRPDRSSSRYLSFNRGQREVKWEQDHQEYLDVASVVQCAERALEAAGDRPVHRKS